MKKVEADVYDCIVATCPYCDKEVIELNSRMRDDTVPDIEFEGTIECKHCGQTFEYEIPE